MIPRYTLPEMGAIWSDAARFEAMLRVELAVARAQAARGLVPADALAALEARARVDVDRIAEIERTTDHDVIAFVSQVAETVGPEGRYLHLGLTSSDVVDTGLALQLRAAGERCSLDGRPRSSPRSSPAPGPRPTTVMMGRTHSVHAEPTTLGLKLAGWAFELDRGRRRLAAAVDEIGDRQDLRAGRDVQPPRPGHRGRGPRRARPPRRPGQHPDRPARPPRRAAHRDRHHRRLARALRDRGPQPPAHRDRRAPGAVQGRPEGLARRCPTSATRSCPSGSPGLARLLRGYAHTALEDQPLWHERDISHSSAERVILPDATILLDYMLVRMTGLVEGLVVRSERMRENIDRGLGLHAISRGSWSRSSRTAGMSREEAYAIVQRAVAAGRRRARAAARPAGRRPGRRPAAVARPARRLLRRRRVPAPRARGHRPARRAGRALAAAHARLRRRWPMLAESFLRSGKVRDLLRARRRPARCSSPRTGSAPSTSSCRRAIPDKGRVLTGLSRFWFAETGGDRRRTTCSATRPGATLAGRLAATATAARRPARPDDDLPAGRGRSRSRSSSAATSRARAGRSTAATGTVCGDRAARRPARERPAARADLHAVDQGRARRATTRTSTSTTMVGARRRRARPSAVSRGDRDRRCAVRLRARRVAERAGILLADTKFEFGLDPATRRAAPHRRGPDARLVALLGCRRLRARAAPGELRQAVRARLARDASRGTRRAPGPALPADVVAGTRARYVEAFERITGASFERYLEEDVIAR